MKSPGTQHLRRGLVVLVCLSLAGCVTLPWASPPPKPHPPEKLPATAPAKSDIVPAQFLAPGRDQEQISLLLEQLHEAKDDRKVLLARVQMLEMQLHSRDQLLLEAAKELQAAKKELDRIQGDSKRWKSEMSSMRSKLEHSETESVESLKEVITTLEQMLKQKQ